jgi:hypothetical protein
LVEIAVRWRGTGAFSYLKLEDAVSPSAAAAVRRQRGRWVGMDIGRAYA